MGCYFPRTDKTLRSGWPNLQKIMSHSVGGEMSRIKVFQCPFEALGLF